MELSRPGGARSIMSGPPPNLVGRNTDALPSNQSSSWHSSRDPGPGPNSANSDPQSHSHSQSQSQSYGSGYGPNSFDGFMPPIGSQQSDILNQAGDGAPGSGTDPNRLNKKRQRDDHEELDPHPDSTGKFNPSPARLAELTAGFPTPTAPTGPPALITTGRMTKTHADPLIAQLINPDGTPKRPMNAFMIFARKRRPEVAADNPNLRTGEISKLLSAEWKAIDNESKQFYLTKAKELKENFTSIFPTYVYKRRPNNSRKRRKTEDTGYGGAAAMSAIDRGEGGLSEDEGDMTPPGGMSPAMGHPNHPMGGIHGMGGMGPGVSRRPGDPMHMSHPPPPYGMIPPPPHHDLGNPYGLHGSQQYRGQGSPQMYQDNVPGGGPASSRNSSGQLWPSLDAKREPKSPRMEGNSAGGAHASNLRVPGGPPPPPSQNGGSGMRNGASSGGSYNFSIPSPNFGPGPGLPPIGRSQGSQGGSNPTSASQTPLLNPSLPPSGSMLPPPAGNMYGHGHSASHGGGHSHAHSGSYFDSGGWPRTQQSPSSSSLNLNGPSGTSSTSAGPPSNERQTPTSSRNRSDSLGGAGSSAPSGPGQWSI